MINWKGSGDQSFPPIGGKVGSPLAPIVRRYLPLLPLVAALGFLATLLEGIGIGLLIPLLALLMAGTLPPDMPEPIRDVAGAAIQFDAQGQILILGAAILALIAIKGLVQGANGCLVASVVGRFGRDVRNSVANRLLALDYPFFLEHDRARLTRIISGDTDQVTEAARSAVALIPAAVGLVVIGALLAWLNLTLFLIAAAGAAIVQATLFIFERRQRELSYQATESDLRLWQRILSVLNGTRVVRIFGQQQREQDRFAAASEHFRLRDRASRWLLAWLSPTMDLMVALLFIAILLAGYWIGMTIPTVTTFLVLLSRAQPHAYIISHSRLGIASYRGALREVEWLLSQEPAKARRPTLSTPFELDRPISFEAVTFIYPNESEALHDVSLTIRPGIATALIGKSGSGKTTLVNLLCRLIEPQEGRIRLGALPVETIDPANWLARIAVAGQDVDLVDGTVAENIAYSRPDAGLPEIEEAARAAGAAEFIAGLPEGYGTQVGQAGLRLSGGQRQRIGLARALLRRPDLLILDEATNAVDAISELEIMKLLHEHRHFRTALVISHRKSTIAACDEGIVIHRGRISEAGPLVGLSYFRTMAGDADAVA